MGQILALLCAERVPVLALLLAERRHAGDKNHAVWQRDCVTRVVFNSFGHRASQLAPRTVEDTSGGIYC